MGITPREVTPAELDAGYEYVVVGGGSAGCVIATRLSEDPGVSVLLVEAGPADGGELVDDPTRWVQLLGGPLDWGHSYAPAPATLDRVIGIPRGRVLGGSSAINALLWYRGHPSDYDAWEAGGAKGWTFNSLLPYFKRSEDWQDGASEYRGAGGPIRIETSSDPHPIAGALLDAAAERGIPVVADANAESNEGATLSNFTVRDGRRCSAASGYLKPALARPNLSVLCDSTALTLEFVDDNCVGIWHTAHGALRLTRATRETILTLGAIDTPALLMRSGVGDPDQLTPLGIRPVAALRGVGANLQDHPLLTGINFVARQPLGPTRDNGGGAMLNVRSSADVPSPDIHAFVVQGRHAEPGVVEKYGLDQMTEPLFAISPGLMRSRSVGELRLLDIDPAAPLYIQPNLLDDRADVHALMAGVDIIMDLVETTAYRSLIERPAAPDRRLTSQERERFVRLSTSTFFHVAGTAAMGSDDRSVVDPELRVHGITGLRVADASVFPTLPSSNTNAPVIAVAERAADLIRGSLPPGPATRRSHHMKTGDA